MSSSQRQPPQSRAFPPNSRLSPSKSLSKLHPPPLNMQINSGTPQESSLSKKVTPLEQCLHIVKALKTDPNTYKYIVDTHVMAQLRQNLRAASAREQEFSDAKSEEIRGLREEYSSLLDI